MSNEKICLVIKSPQLGKLLQENTLDPSEYQVILTSDLENAQALLTQQAFDVVIIEVGNDLEASFQFVENLSGDHPSLGIILLNPHSDEAILRKAMCLGVSDLLTLPIRPGDILRSIQGSLSRRHKLQTWIRKQTQRNTDSLRRHVDELKELEEIGHSITASLDLDHVLTVIVDTAVRLTGAEEGSLLMLDEDSGELVMRASRNFQDDFVRTFRLPVKDTLAGDVIRTGEPVMITKDSPQKIKTQYLVRTLMYVPLQIQGKVIGVLGVDNRESQQSFSQQQLSLVSTLAGYAAIAIENARLYHDTEIDRQKLDSILAQIEDGVIVISTDHRVVLVNRTARSIFGVEGGDFIGSPVGRVFNNETLIEILVSDHREFPYRCEIVLEDGYILNSNLVQIPGVGYALTLQDISYFKELDRIKTEFVQTISHDLRSPLTAILGYVELINRVGEVNKQQQEFINRVRISVRNIAELINNLLELGRIEAGFDTRKEFVPMGIIMQYAIDSLYNQIDELSHELTVDISKDVPNAYGDPVRLRQVVDVLLNNAVRYTVSPGHISLRLHAEKDQLILQVEDDGLGIPLQDQPYIFEKFFRGSNVPDSVNGSGLGLAIVKSIVENHQGRVWVDSTVGVGSCFTVMLPITKQAEESA
jgi:two-component system NtrC family sensor kinase